MSKLFSIKDIDLAPVPDKKYWNADRDWREDFIYFLMVDRFHDDLDRKPVQTDQRSPGSGSREQLRRFCGGTLRGIMKHLDYINNLGCTALWLSPVFENNDAPDRDSDKYHGYSITNYLEVDPRFGTKQDLIDLVDAAHKLGIKVYLDAVANHSGDVWYYLGGNPYFFHKDTQFQFGGWRYEDRPLPIELRNPNFFHRRGEIKNWDDYPETHHGDFFSLKGFNNDEDRDGRLLQDIMIKAHCYWIREADIDGFRMDAVKHMGELAVARFCSAVREYSYTLGKRGFFLFGELVAGDNAIDRYVGPNTSKEVHEKTVYFGLSSVLDFPLYWVLPDVIKGFSSPIDLFSRYEAQRNRALSMGEIGRYLVTFIDNHDQIGQDFKRRFAADATDRQVIAAAGYLLCALGTPCIYYGTEQGLSGEGEGDEFIREAMFDLMDPEKSLLNQNCTIYKGISKIARIFRERPAVRFGRMYFREVSVNGRDFALPDSQPCTLAFSRILADQEVLIAYNTSTTETRNDYVTVDNSIQKEKKTLNFLYGKEGTVPIEEHPYPGNESLFVRLELEPMQFVILS